MKIPTSRRNILPPSSTLKNAGVYLQVNTASKTNSDNFTALSTSHLVWLITSCEGVNWIHLAQDRDQWRAIFLLVERLSAFQEGLCSIE
jgi:hypothetical protein